MKIRNPKLRGGHAPGHVRDTFLAAIDAYCHWKDDEPEPMVEFEVNYKPFEIPISRACTLVWICTDCVPGLDGEMARNCGLEFQNWTYAAIARAMHQAIKQQAA
jgi:hypothetical protein